jgi:hypothetical protein
MSLLGDTRAKNCTAFLILNKRQDRKSICAWHAEWDATVGGRGVRGVEQRFGRETRCTMWRVTMNVTITILDIIHRLKTRFGDWILSPSQVEPVSGNRLALFILPNLVVSTWRRRQNNLRNAVFWIEDSTMDNVQNCHSYINIPSSQSYR